MKTISIDPITRLEGHGKISIFLDENGNVANAFLQIPELRGFEKFCEGRRAEDMPIITTRICGVCPVAHHLASAKALDAAFSAQPTDTAKKLRELMYAGYFIYDHILHFYFLGSPDFIVGPDAHPSERNIVGVLRKMGFDIVREVIRHRAYGQKITEILGGKATHPVSALPGGVSKGLSEAERSEIESMARSSVKFALSTINIFNDVFLKSSEYLEMIHADELQLKTYNMGLVDESNKMNFYDGDIRVTDQNGREVFRFKGSDYLKYVAEHVEPWTYSKFTYLKKIGWKGLIDGSDSGVYRVGPLARLNVAEGMSTPLADEEYRRMFETIGGKPVNSTFAYHWARIIELLYASERALELSTDPSIMGSDLRNPIGEPGEGVGVVEAARGTLIHHYKIDDKGLVQKANLIVATTNNYSDICISIREAAKKLIQGGKVDEGLLNRVEMAYRAYDPCFGCSTHTFSNNQSLTVEIYDAKGSLHQILERRGN